MCVCVSGEAVAEILMLKLKFVFLCIDKLSYPCLAYWCHMTDAVRMLGRSLMTDECLIPAGSIVRAPHKLLCLKWVEKTWNGVTCDVIVLACRISSCKFGSDDVVIHCLKPG